jgi:hypothetical protein
MSGRSGNGSIARPWTKLKGESREETADVEPRLDEVTPRDASCPSPFSSQLSPALFFAPRKIGPPGLEQGATNAEETANPKNRNVNSDALTTLSAADWAALPVELRERIVAHFRQRNANQ